MNEMDAAEVYRWMAYEHSIDPDNFKKLTNEIHLERSAEQTPEQRAEAIRQMFMALGNKNG